MTPTDELTREEQAGLLDDSSPLYDSEKYREIDPNGLLKAEYETWRDKEKTLRSLFSEKFRESRKGYRDRLLRRMHRDTAFAVINTAQRIAAAALYFENNRGLARDILSQARELLNRTKYRGPYGMRECACSFAESIGVRANRLGLPEIADRCGRATMCPKSPQWRDFRSAVGVSAEGKVYAPEDIEGYILETIESGVEHLQKQSQPTE